MRDTCALTIPNPLIITPFVSGICKAVRQSLVLKVHSSHTATARAVDFAR